MAATDLGKTRGKQTADKISGGREALWKCLM